MPRRRPTARSAGLGPRIALFSALAFVLLVMVGYLLWPKPLATTDAAPVDLTLRVSMEGFDPPTITAPANRSLRVRIVNPDNSHHSDGGGVHEFAVTALGLDAKIQPLSTQVVTIPPSPAGDYAFYCDTCCGGKENPSMQGTLKLRAS